MPRKSVITSTMKLADQAWREAVQCLALKCRSGCFFVLMFFLCFVFVLFFHVWV